MSDIPHIQTLLHKFILNECSPQEIEEVIAYYQNNKLTSEFPTVEDVSMLIEELPKMETSTADQIFSNIIGHPEGPTASITPRKRSYKRYIAVAASMVILLSIGISYRHLFSVDQPEPVMDSHSEEITLQLENGEIQVISENDHLNVKDSKGNVVGNQDGNKIIYDTEMPIEKLAYNTIRIPNGKRFALQLSDGTVVHLNAGTSLKYPIKFIAGESRSVFLDGEAFFDVAKDKQHPFVVNADQLNIRVLGTHFNVSNYPEDDATDVVLVEGSVGLYTQNENFDAAKNVILKPGYKGSLDKTGNQISAQPVITDMYTSWINGGQNFRNMAFKNIIKKLERRYNVSIINLNNKLAEEKFNASFKDEPLEKVLGYFNEIHGFNYSIKNNKVLINKN